MPTIVGILTFMSMINFVISSGEHEKSFITSEPRHHYFLHHVKSSVRCTSNARKTAICIFPGITRTSDMYNNVLIL